MLVIGGRHMIRQELKGGLQEMDHTRLFNSITKWSATAWQVDRLADYVSTAARHAFDGQGGPVFLDVPWTFSSTWWRRPRFDSQPQLVSRPDLALTKRPST